MDSLKIQGIPESWFPKISWDFLIFFYIVTNIWNKMEIFEQRFKRFSKIQLHDVRDSGFVMDPLGNIRSASIGL